MLSVLSGHSRYTHINGIRGDGVNPELLGLSSTVSEDAVRTAMYRIKETTGLNWRSTQFIDCIYSAYAVLSIFDIDVTVKPFYGRQQGAENCFDELKNQSGWRGFTSHNLAPSRLIANFIALFYNWSSFYVRFYDEGHHREIIRSRPMLMAGAGR